MKNISGFVDLLISLYSPFFLLRLLRYVNFSIKLELKIYLYITSPPHKINKFNRQSDQNL